MPTRSILCVCKEATMPTPKTTTKPTTKPTTTRAHSDVLYAHLLPVLRAGMRVANDADVNCPLTDAEREALDSMARQLDDIAKSRAKRAAAL
jgi:hypothetical protein